MKEGKDLLISDFTEPEGAAGPHTGFQIAVEVPTPLGERTIYFY